MYNLQNKKGRKPKEKRYHTIFADKLKVLLDEKDKQGITLSAIAKELGITRQSLAQYRDGNNIPDINVLQRMTEYFKVSADYLITDTEIRTPDVDFIAACEYTGLSEDAMDFITSINFRIDNAGEVTAHQIVSEIITSDLFYMAVRDIMNAIELCQKEQQCNDETKKGDNIDDIINMLEKNGLACCEYRDLAEKHAQSAYAAFKPIIDDVIANLSGTNGFLLQYRELAFSHLLSLRKNTKGG